MTTPYFFYSEDLGGTAQCAVYISAASGGTGVTLNRIAIDLVEWPYADSGASPVLALGVQPVASALNTTTLTGPGPVRAMHSASLTPSSTVWVGPPIPHFGPYCEIWDVGGAQSGRRVLDFADIGGFRAEAGHYLAIQMWTAFNSVGDGAGNDWLQGTFRAMFFIEE